MLQAILDLILENPAATVMGFLATFFLFLYFFAEPMTELYNKWKKKD